MNRMLSLRLAPALLIAGLSLFPVQAALAADGPAAGYCADNPQACSDAAERIRKRCAEDPAACEKARDRIQDAREKCAADPQACEEKKAQFREKRDELKAKCDADPAACERKKEEIRQRLRERGRNRVSPAGETPPIIPPKPSS